VVVNLTGQPQAVQLDGLEAGAALAPWSYRILT